MKGSGKSTAAELIKDLCGSRVPVQVIGFADPIKEFCGPVYGFSDAASYGPSAEREKPIPFDEAARFAAYTRAKRITIQLEIWGRTLARDLSYALPAFWDWQSQVSTAGRLSGDQITPRFVFQTFGTEFGRNVLGESFWIDLALAKADRFATLHPVKVGKTVISDCRFDNETIAVKKHRQGNLVLEIVNAEARGVVAFGNHASEQPCTVPPDFKIFNYPSRGLDPLRQEIRRCTYL